MKKKQNSISSTVLIVGILCLVMGFGILIKNATRPAVTEVAATIVCTRRNEYHSDMKRGYYVYADYEYEGKRYTDILIDKSDRYPPKVGEQVIVCVENDNPTNAIEKNNIGKPIPLIIIGVLGILYAFYLKKNEKGVLL